MSERKKKKKTHHKCCKVVNKTDLQYVPRPSTQAALQRSLPLPRAGNYYCHVCIRLNNFQAASYGALIIKKRLEAIKMKPGLGRSLLQNLQLATCSPKTRKKLVLLLALLRFPLDISSEEKTRVY